MNLREMLRIARREMLRIARRAGLAAVLAAATLLSCSPGGPRSVIVAVGTLPARLDPVTASTPAEENACELLFDGLVDVAANESGAATPALGLASSISQDPSDRSVYRITLKEARWHDGRAVDSWDVGTSFAAYADPANESPRRDYLLGLVASVEPEGPLSLSVRFREPIAAFRAWYVLAFKVTPRLFEGKTLPADRRGPAGEAFALRPVGTGPFRLASRGEDELAFAAEPSSMRGAPASAGLVLRRIPESRDRIRALLRGRVDMIADTGPLDRPELERSGDAMVQSYMPHAFYSMAVNLRDPALARLEAREALARAIDRAALLPGLTDRGRGIQLNTGPFPDRLLQAVLPEYFQGGFPDRHPRSPELATRLATASGLALASSGLRRAGGTARGLGIAYPRSWGGFGERLAAALAAQLALVGVASAPDPMTDAEHAAALGSGSYDLALVYHEGFDNLCSGISALYRSGSPLNETGVSDPRLDRLLARRDADVEVGDWIRDTLALHELASEILPYVPLFTIEKDLFYRGLGGVLIASDNPFLTAERWSIAGDRR
jgi:peptide/nickel transport system substrate-binding protein